VGTVERIAAIAAGVIVLLLALAQLVLPRIAASVISSRVGRYGSVQSVKVSAWPAIELLWEHAGSVEVRARRLRLSTAQSAALLWEARHIGRVDFSAASVQLGPLALSGARVSKRGTALSGEAHASASAVAAALPPGISMALVGSSGGQVTVRAGGGLFGVGASVEAVASAKGGKLVARPVGFPLSAIQLTLFSDPHVQVQGVGARAEGAGYELRMSASLG
jgi:hypothetical protein